MVAIFPFNYPTYSATYFSLNKNCHEKTDTSWKLVDGFTKFYI